MTVDKRLFATVLSFVLSVLTIITAPSSAIDILTLDKVLPGQTGVGYTVIEGTQIVTFPVEIIDVLPGAGPSGDLILIEASGAVMEKTGGIASGMSGSPVYIDGKLIGAIGYGFQNINQKLGLVTPIEQMLSVLNLVKSPSTDDGDDGITETPFQPYPILNDAVPLAMPISVAGFGSRTGRMIDLLFAQRGNPVSLGAGIQGASSGFTANDLYSEALLPGSPLAVQLVRGDVNVAAIGTLTAVDDDGFIGFGHTMSSFGDVAFLATTASVARTVPSSDMPFKIGTIGQPVGMITQDRQAAIAGRLGQLPSMTRIDMTVHDQSRNETQQFTADVVDHDEIMSTLLVISALEAFDRGIDRIGQGTASVSFQIEGDGLPRVLSRENVFFSSTDIAGRALWELYDALRRLQANLIQAPDIRKVTVDVTVSKERKTASIEKVTPVTRHVAPGEEVQVDVTLQPFRMPAVQVPVIIRIPPGAAPGPLSLTVRGGEQNVFMQLGFLLEEQFSGATDDFWDDPSLAGNASFERLIEQLESEPQNNDIVVEFYPVIGGRRDRELPRQASGEDPGDDPADEADDIESLTERDEDDGNVETQFENERPRGSRLSPVQTLHRTDFVLHGMVAFELIITGDQAEDAF